METLGAQIVVHFDVDAPKVITADTERMHVFDPETGMAIRS